MSQTDRLLELLRRKGPDGVTALEALEAIGSFRLAARVADLREAGFIIDTEMVTLPNGKRIARYRIADKLTLW